MPKRKITGLTIRFCNLTSSTEITYMLVAIEPRRFGKHKIYHIILQEVRNNLLAAAVQIHDVIDKNKQFHLQSTPCNNVWTGVKGSNRITLSAVISSVHKANGGSMKACQLPSAWKVLKKNSFIPSPH